jgi:hypothetical protein
MNFGTYELERKIWKQIDMGVTVSCKGGTKKFVKDLAKQLYKFIEEEMNQDMRTQARAKGIPDKVSLFSERAGKALGFFAMPLDPISIVAYEWIMEQETKGQTIEAFAEWARKEESKYMGKYRKEAGNIRNDWARAFTIKKATDRAAIIQPMGDNND